VSDQSRELEVESHGGDVPFPLPPDAGSDLFTDVHDERARPTAGFDLSPYRASSGEDEVNPYEGNIDRGGPLVRLTMHDGSFDLRMR